MVNLNHLGSEANALAMLPGIERRARLRMERWIGYTRANQTLAQLEALLSDEPGKLRPQNLLIIGPSNNGKTLIPKNSIERIPNRFPMMVNTRSFQYSCCKCQPRQLLTDYTQHCRLHSLLPLAFTVAMICARRRRCGLCVPSAYAC